jgi:arginine deiminase
MARAADRVSFGAESMWAPLRRVLVKRPEDAFVSPENLSREWRRFGYLACPDWDEARREFDAFLAILARHVPEIDFLPTDPRVGLDSLYVHDPVKVTRQGAVLLNPGKRLRRGEPAAAADALAALGIPVVGRIEDPASIEGGDIVWLDDGRVALGRGYRTNEAGIRAFLDLVGDRAEVVVVPLPHADGPDACLHLMSLISIVDRDLAVVYSRYLPVAFREWLVDHGFQLVEVPDAEYETLGANVLALGPRLCVMLDGHPITQRRLEQAGATVYTYRGQEISWKGTGGPTCLTAPLLRSATHP